MALLCESKLSECLKIIRNLVKKEENCGASANKWPKGSWPGVYVGNLGILRSVLRL